MTSNSKETIQLKKIAEFITVLKELLWGIIREN